MAPRLTGRQKKKLIADFVELGNYTAVASKHGVSRNTVKNAVLSDPQFARKCQDKAQADARAILEHLASKRQKVNQIIDLYMDELLDLDQFEKVTPAQLAQVIGSLVETCAVRGAPGDCVKEADDPITAALKESVDHGILSKAD